MAEVINSLFGITPESLTAQREQALQEQAMQYAKMDPFQRATAGIYKGASQLGGAVGGMLGAQDPEMMRIQQRQSMLQNVDLTNPESLKQGIQTAMQNKDYQLVSELTNRYQQSVATGLSTRKTESEIAKNLREKAGADPVQQLLRTGKYTISSLGDYERSGNIADLVPVDPNEPTQITETAEGVVLVNKKTGEVVKRIGAPVERGTKVGVSVDAKGETEFVKELGKADAKKVTEAATLRDTAVSSLNSLNKLAELPSQNLISGQFATGRVGATNLLATLGLASPSDVAKLGTSQQYQKVAGDVILQTLGGKLGSGFSNADREFIAGLVPQLETDPEARRKLIQFMQRKNQDIVQETTRLEEYARQNKGLGGFKPKIPLAVTPTGQYSNLSDAELEARIRAARVNR